MDNWNRIHDVLRLCPCSKYEATPHSGGNFVYSYEFLNSTISYCHYAVTVFEINRRLNFSLGDRSYCIKDCVKKFPIRVFLSCIVKRVKLKSMSITSIVIFGFLPDIWLRPLSLGTVRKGVVPTNWSAYLCRGLRSSGWLARRPYLWADQDR